MSNQHRPTDYPSHDDVVDQPLPIWKYTEGGGPLCDYLYAQDTCNAAQEAAEGKTIREFWPGMPTSWRLCLMNLLDGRNLLDQEWMDEVNQMCERGLPVMWTSLVSDGPAKEYLDEHYPFSMFEDAARKLGLL